MEVVGSFGAQGIPGAGGKVGCVGVTGTRFPRGRRLFGKRMNCGRWAGVWGDPCMPWRFCSTAALGEAGGRVHGVDPPRDVSGSV